MILNTIGQKYGCDKCDQHHTFKGETYFDVYEKYFSKFRDEEITFLEFGVRDGASIATWLEYFPKAKIIGVDIQPQCQRFQNERLTVEIGSQDDPEFIKRIIEEHGPFDIVLDDASHINSLSIATFKLLKAHVKDGGMYIIEDLRNSYEDLTEDVKQWPGMHLNEDVCFDNSITRTDLDKVLLDVVKELDYRTSDYRAVNFHSQMVILER
jgi:hypothetical protein